MKFTINNEVSGISFPAMFCDPRTSHFLCFLDAKPHILGHVSSIGMLPIPRFYNT